MSHYRITVTDLHLMQRCPRLLREKYAGRQVAFVGLNGCGVNYGRIFHNDIIGPFHQDLANNVQNSDGICREKLFENLTKSIEKTEQFELFFKQIFQQLYLMPYLQNSGKMLAESQCERILSASDLWIRKLSDFLVPIIQKYKQCSPANRPSLKMLFAQIFNATEKTITVEYQFPNHETIQISGQCDVVLFDPYQKTTEIVEFKCRKATDQTEDFAQLVLYSWLIRQSLGQNSSAKILYFDDTNPACQYDALILQKTADSQIPSLLEQARAILQSDMNIPMASDRQHCNQCPVYQECYAQNTHTKDVMPNVKKTHALSVPIETKPNNGFAEADTLLKMLIQSYAEFHLNASPYDPPYIVGPRIIRLQICPELGGSVTMSRYLNKAKDLMVMMAIPDEPLIRTRAGFISVDVARSSPESVFLSQLFERGKSTQPISPIAFPLGVTIEGEVFWVDLTDSIATSILIGGTAGSGKSVLLQSMVLGIGRAAEPGNVLFTLIDPKQVSFQQFRKLPILNRGEIITEMTGAIETLRQIIDEMEIRYEMLTKSDVEHIQDYNEKHKEQPLFHHVIIIDEYADLLSDRKLAKQFSEIVQRLCQKGRAAGIHLVLATQRPDCHVVTPLVRANLQLKIAMKVATEKNSKIILDEDGAECLAGYGDMLVKGAIPTVRIQGPRSSQDDLLFLQKCHLPVMYEMLRNMTENRYSDFHLE